MTACDVPPEGGNTQALHTAVAAVGVALDAETAARLQCYVALLERWGRAFNLVGDAADLVNRHIADSAVVGPILDARPGAAVTDLGSGAGFPGMVAAIMQPGRDYRLVDARGAKTRFLRQVVTELQLARVTVVRARIETLAASACSELLLARALAPLPKLAGLCDHLLANDSELVAWKGPDAAAEMAALPAGFEAQTAAVYTLPGRTVEHHLVRLRRCS